MSSNQMMNLKILAASIFSIIAFPWVANAQTSTPYKFDQNVCRAYNSVTHEFMGQIYFDSNHQLRIEYKRGIATPAYPITFDGEAQYPQPMDRRLFSKKEIDNETESAELLLSAGELATLKGPLCGKITYDPKYAIAVNEGVSKMFYRSDYFSLVKMMKRFPDLRSDKFLESELQDDKYRLGEKVSASIEKDVGSISTGGAPLVQNGSDQNASRGGQ